jgi:hypothetical protein
VPLIIDTYNVLHVTGVLPGELAVGEPEALARLIESSRFAREAVWLVCDGTPRGASRIGRIVIEGAGPGRSADDHIVETLERDSAPRRITVVTSDRAIARRAKARGAECLKSEEFLSMLAQDARRAPSARVVAKAKAPDPRRAVPLDARAVMGWMRLFGISAELAAVEGAARPAGEPATRTPKTRDEGPASARKNAEHPRGAGSRPFAADLAGASPSSISGSTSGGSDAALERYLAATKDLADPLSILERREGEDLLAALGDLGDAEIDALMRAHEPSVEKDGTHVGGRRRERRAIRKGKKS